MKRWAYAIVFSLVSASVLYIGGCTEADLSTADKVVSDANTVSQVLAAVPESAVGPLIPPPVLAVLKLLGCIGAAAFGVWQEIRRRGLLTAGKVLVRAVESTDEQTAARVKMAVETESRKANVEPQVRATVKKLKAS